jgi:hypothetical protein
METWCLTLNIANPKNRISLIPSQPEGMLRSERQKMNVAEKTNHTMATETKTEITFPSAISGLVWRENINGPINWFLEEIEATGYSKAAGTYYPKGYGSVQKDYRNKFTTNLPKPYEPETDSDAYSVGEFDTMEEAMKAVENSYNRYWYY